MAFCLYSCPFFPSNQSFKTQIQWHNFSVSNPPTISMLFQIKSSPDPTDRVWCTICLEGLLTPVDLHMTILKVWFLVLLLNFSLIHEHLVFKIIAMPKIRRMFNILNMRYNYRGKIWSKVKNRKCHFLEILKCIFNVSKMNFPVLSIKLAVCGGCGEENLNLPLF